DQRQQDHGEADASHRTPFSDPTRPFTSNSSERKTQRETMGAAEPTLIGPRVIEAVIERLRPTLEAGAERPAQLRVALERVLVTRAHRQSVPDQQLGPGADALGVVAGMKRVHLPGQPRLSVQLMR